MTLAKQASPHWYVLESTYHEDWAIVFEQHPTLLPAALADIYETGRAAPGEEAGGWGLGCSAPPAKLTARLRLVGEGWLLDIADRLDERVSCVQPSPDRRSTLLQTRKHLFEHVLAACPLEAFETAHMLCGGQAAPFPAAYAAVGKLVDEALESLPHASPSSIIFAIRAICRSLDRGNRGK